MKHYFVACLGLMALNCAKPETETIIEYRDREVIKEVEVIREVIVEVPVTMTVTETIVVTETEYVTACYADITDHGIITNNTVGFHWSGTANVEYFNIYSQLYVEGNSGWLLLNSHGFANTTPVDLNGRRTIGALFPIANGIPDYIDKYGLDARRFRLTVNIGCETKEYIVTFTP